MVDLTDWGFQIATKKSYSVQTTNTDQRDMSTSVTNTSADNRTITYSPTYVINSAGATAGTSITPSVTSTQTPSITTKKTTTADVTPTSSVGTSEPSILGSITTIGVVAVVVGGVYLFFKKGK